MSATGDCFDNAVAESFFASLKTEWVDRQAYATHAAAVASIAEYIDGFYNPRPQARAQDHCNPRIQTAPAASDRSLYKPIYMPGSQLLGLNPAQVT